MEESALVVGGGRAPGRRWRRARSRPSEDSARSLGEAELSLARRSRRRARREEEEGCRRLSLPPSFSISPSLLPSLSLHRPPTFSHVPPPCSHILLPSPLLSSASPPLPSPTPFDDWLRWRLLRAASGGLGRTVGYCIGLTLRPDLLLCVYVCGASAGSVELFYCR